MRRQGRDVPPLPIPAPVPAPGKAGARNAVVAIFSWIAGPSLDTETAAAYKLAFSAATLPAPSAAPAEFRKSWYSQGTPTSVIPPADSGSAP